MAPQWIVPDFYRVTFTWFDSLQNLISGYGLIFHRDAMIKKVSPFFAPPVVAYYVCLWQVAGGYWVVAVMQGSLLRYSDDLGIWKVCNAAFCGTDALQLLSFIEMRQPPHNWSRATMGWRQWGIVVVTIILVLIRVLFIFEMGLETGDKRD